VLGQTFRRGAEVVVTPLDSLLDSSHWNSLPVANPLPVVPLKGVP
jgi:hypothetical protein